MRLYLPALLYMPSGNQFPHKNGLNIKGVKFAKSSLNSLIILLGIIAFVYLDFSKFIGVKILLYFSPPCAKEGGTRNAWRKDCKVNIYKTSRILLKQAKFKSKQNNPSATPWRLPLHKGADKSMGKFVYFYINNINKRCFTAFSY